MGLLEVSIPLPQRAGQTSLRPQVYSAITGSTKWLDLTLAAILASDIRTEATLFFALTTALGALQTADIFIIGDDLS